MFTTPSITTKGDLDAAVTRSRTNRKRKQISHNHDDSDADTAHDEHPPPKKSKVLVRCQTESDSDKREERSRGKHGSESNGPTKHEEKRLRRFRSHAPQSYLEIKGRALTQRLTVLDRERCGTDEEPEEKVTMAGSTGNVYTQHICRVPTCDCPHAKKGNQCKHIVYVMLRVLKSPENVGYQLALTSEELRELFKNAAPIPSVMPNETNLSTEDGNRKAIEDECPICYVEFDSDKESIVYCKSGCGNNVHKDCMQKWTAAKADKTTCPYCRAPWAEGDVGLSGGKVDIESGIRTDDGYVNVAGQLGLSRERDYSTYHPFWVRQEFGYGGRRGGF